MPMKPNDIYAELVRRGLSAAKVARSIGFSNQTVMDVIHGKSKNVIVRKALANLLNRSVDEVFQNNEAPECKSEASNSAQ